MNTFQRVIKYVAIGFAIFLTLVILTGIVSAVSGIVSIFDRRDEDTIDYSKDFSGIEELDINHKVGRLIIKPGNGFRVEATNTTESFRAEVVNKTLVIDESDLVKRFLWFDFGSFRHKSVITVYVPEDFDTKRIMIESGVGEVDLLDLSTDQLIIDASVGDIYGRGLTAKSVEVEGGVGNIKLVDVNFTDADFDCGVGDIKVEGMLFGESDFKCAVGNVRIQLNGSRDDYALKVDSGIGKVKVNGEKLSRGYDDSYDADNTMKITGGVGEVDLVFIN